MKLFWEVAAAIAVGILITSFFQMRSRLEILEVRAIAAERTATQAMQRINDLEFQLSELEGQCGGN